MMKELPRVNFSKLSFGGGLNSTKMRELLADGLPHVFTADGVPICIIMSPETYQAMLPVDPNPPRQPKMVRVDGTLFREVI